MLSWAFRYSDEPPLDDETEELLYVRELVASRFHDACSSRLSQANGKASARSEKRDFPRVTVRRIDLSAPKFRMSRRRRADWSSLGYGSDDRSRGRASLAQVPSSDSTGVANGTTARDDRARDRRRTSLSTRGNTCGIQIGPSVHIVDRELIRQDLEDMHISPESSRAQSRANTATYILCHDVVHNANNGTNDPEEVPKIRRVKLDTLQQQKSIRRPIIGATTEPTNPAGKSGKYLEEVRNSDSRQNDGRIESPKIRHYRQERKDREPDPQDAEDMGISECLENATSRGAVKFAVIDTPRSDRNEKLKNKARNENHEGIACGDTEIRYAEDGGIFRERNGADRRNDENTVDKIQEENRGDRSQPAGDTSRKAGFPRCENNALRCREMESPRPYRTIDGHVSHTFNSHNGQDELYDVAGEDVRRRSLASGYTDISRVEDNLDEIDLYRPRLDDLDSVLHFNDRKIERVVRATRNLSELLSGPEFAIYKLDEDEQMPQDASHEKLYWNSLADKDNKCPFMLNESARLSTLETELRNDLMVPEIRKTAEELQGTNVAGTKSSAFTRENGSRSNCLKNSTESSVFPASDASDSPRTSRDSDKARSAAKARLSESLMDRSDTTTFSNLVPALSSTHTETQTCRHREEAVAPSDCHEEPRVTSASRHSEAHRSGKEYTDDGIFSRLFRKDTSQAMDRFVACILQDEKRSIEGKVASALRESAITPAAVQKLLDHLREAESIRDARQTETLDILRNILINIKSQSDQGNANDKETIGGLTSREEGAQQTRAKIDTSKIERVAKNSYGVKGSGEHFSDLSECRETRESARSTARCESTRGSENNSKKDIYQTEIANVARTVPIDAENQTDKGIDENDPKKEVFPGNVAGIFIQTNATSNATEGTILRTRGKNNTNRQNDESNDLGNPDKYFSISPAVPETRESARSAAHFESARGSKNNSKNNSKGNSCSEAESLKQISDIRNDDDNENLGKSSEHLSTKIASARSKGERETEAADLVGAIVVSDNKENDINSERFGEDKSNNVRANKHQPATKIVTQTDQLIDVRSDIPEEAVKEITSEKMRDSDVPLSDKRVLFAFPEVSEIKNGCKDASPARPKFIDEVPTKRDANLVRSPAKVDTESLRETDIVPQHIVVKEKINPADNYSLSVDPPQDCTLPSAKSSESSLQEVASRNKQISLNIVANSLRDMRDGEIRKSMTFATIENRRDGNEVSGPQKTARNDNERQPIDLTDTPGTYKIDVLFSSNSSVSSTLLDDR